MRNPVPNLPVVVGRPVLSFVRSFEEICSIMERIFSAEKAAPLCSKVMCASASSRPASMRTRTLPSMFTSLAFWISSQTHRLDVVGDAPARSFVSSLWIFVAIIRDSRLKHYEEKKKENSPSRRKNIEKEDCAATR